MACGCATVRDKVYDLLVGVRRKEATAEYVRTKGILEESREDMEEYVASSYQTEHGGSCRTSHHLPLSFDLLPSADFHAPLRSCVLSRRAFLVTLRIFVHLPGPHKV